MMVLVGLALLAVAEIWTAVVVAQWIGALATAVLLVALSVLGVVLVRAEGVTVWRRVNEDLAAGQVPTTALLDGFMIVIGGVLLVIPGFLTAIPGLALLLPPGRALLRPVVQRWIERRAGRSAAFGSVTFAGVRADADPRGRRGSYAEVIDVEVHRPQELGRPD